MNMKTRITRRWRQAKTLAQRIHQDERGAEGLEKLLIVAAIVLPLLALLILFRNALSEWVSGLWDDVRSDADDGIINPS